MASETVLLWHLPQAAGHWEETLYSWVCLHSMLEAEAAAGGGSAAAPGEAQLLPASGQSSPASLQQGAGGGGGAGGGRRPVPSLEQFLLRCDPRSRASTL